MDKKFLLSKNLADIMSLQLNQLQEILRKHPVPTITYKEDSSPVTELDLALSAHVESLMLSHFPEFTFYSEEKFSEWKFPLLALDPLDGTREYIAGRSEWAISIGLFHDENFSGGGWVYNPVTEENLRAKSVGPFVDKPHFYGEVSRSEWEKKLFTESEKYQITPMGSIAYKLGRLAAGKIDFVVSLRPKNIWDIAGGSLLCQEAGLKFYSEGQEVTKVKKLYHPPLIWCREELLPELLKIFPSKDKYP